VFPRNEKKGLIDLEDFFDEKYMEEELPEDFLYSRISDMFKEDPELKVLRQIVMYDGKEMSRVCAINMDADHIDVGPKYMQEPIYLPKEDFRSTDLMLEWFDDFRANIYRDLPDLPAPQPIIPSNQYYRPEYDHFVENFMNNKGAIIVDPTIGLENSGLVMNVCGCQDKRGLPTMEQMEYNNNAKVLRVVDPTLDIEQSDKCNTVYKEEDEQYEVSDKEYVIVEQPIEPLLFFFPFRDIQKENLHKVEKRNYIAMQFNPFHPMSIRCLQEYSWNDKNTIISGTYIYRHKEFKFEFDINDQRYRIHSHIWLQIARGYRFSGFLEVFDLVGNFPFNDKLHLIPKDVYVEPLIIEPLAAKKKIVIPQLPYSFLGNGNYYERGVNRVALCPYANYIMENKDLDVTWAIDITDQVELNNDSLKIGDNYIRIKKRELQSDDFFLKYYDNNKYKVYERVYYRGIYEGVYVSPPLRDELYYAEQKKIGKHLYVTSFRDYYIAEEDHQNFLINFDMDERAFKFKFMTTKFYSFPRNRSGSLVIDFRNITLHDAVQMDSTTLHEYWPYLVPFTEDMEVDNEYDYSKGEGPILDVFEFDEHLEDIGYEV